ncbi:hypothetical protein TNCV_3636611 [Trichonephila clavipes]|nr:hypothetical protein TNCV_3636611 [Trichonephila clavipes]
MQPCTATGGQVSQFNVARLLHKGGLFACCIPLKIAICGHGVVWGGFMLNRRTELHVFDRGSSARYDYCKEAQLHPQRNIQQLKQMLIEEWSLLPQELLDNLVMNMERRCEATIVEVTCKVSTFVVN